MKRVSVADTLPRLFNVNVRGLLGQCTSLQQYVADLYVGMCVSSLLKMHKDKLLLYLIAAFIISEMRLHVI